MNGRRRIVQLLAGFADGDAISGESRAFHQAFLRLGLDAALFAVDGHISPSVADQCLPLSEYRPQEGDIVLHHYGIESPACDAFLRARGVRILKYHNITPGHFFRGYDDEMMRRLERARARLAEVAAASHIIWADSAYNAAELKELGADRVRVFPLAFDPAEWEVPPDPSIWPAPDAHMTNFLFVGRLVPNKCVEDLILAFAWYREALDPSGRLIVVGSKQSCPRYYAMLRMLTAELRLENVFLQGFASQESVAAYFRIAHAFVTASRHEGYCLPVLEAMWHGVPVIARDVGGIPESTGRACVLYDEASPNELAGLLHAVAKDPALRARILEAQARRVQELRQRDLVAEVRALLQEAVPDL